MSRKERLTVTIDRDILEAGHEAVAEGRADSLSAWVNRALAERIAKERRLSALGQAIASYEEEFGTISEEELLLQARADRAAARVVRGPGNTAPRRREETG